MKKILWLVLLLLPFMVLAYSDYIIPGGDTLGIEVNSKGIMVIGFYKVKGKNINTFLEVGDKITYVKPIKKVLVKYLEKTKEGKLRHASLK